MSQCNGETPVEGCEVALPETPPPDATRPNHALTAGAQNTNLFPETGSRPGPKLTPPGLPPNPHSTASKMPRSLSLRTECQSKQRPFIATYTPGGRVCTKARAVPRLKRPSELPNL